MFSSMTYLTYDLENFWFFFSSGSMYHFNDIILSCESKKKPTTSCFTYPNFNAQKQQ